MMDFVREAGFGIWPVMVFGALAVALAARHAARPRGGGMPLVVGTSVLTLLFGLLGTVVGIQTSVRYLHQVEDADRWIFLVGLRESLNNMVAALVIVALAGILAMVGAHRASRSRDRSSVPITPVT